MTIRYRIKDWNAHFENNKSREREKCSFCCIPNKQDGLGYGMLLRMENGEAIYGAFVAILLVASKQKKRSGWLTANGLPGECPLTARQLSVKCQFSEKTIQKMLKVVSSNEIGWIEAVSIDCPPSANEVPAKCPPSALEGREGKGKKEGEGSSPSSLKLSDRISFEREIKAVGQELQRLGKLSDYDPGSKSHNRILELSKRQTELRKILGVTA